jgi:glycosyltransferase involved in cell wall biosynthesis
VSTRPITVGLDATPLLGHRTGIGRYVQQLLAALADGPTGGMADGPAGGMAGAAGGSGPAGPGPAGLSLVAAAFTWRGRGGLTPAAPATVRLAGRRAPARALQELWARSEWPPVEWLTGRLDVMHGTNFVLPPSRRAGGVVTVHDLAYLHSPALVGAVSLRYRELVPRSLRRAALVLTPTRAVADELTEAYRLDADRVRVTPLGVDPGWAATDRPSPGWLADRGLPPEYLLAVGTLEPRKGLDVLLRAYAAVHAADPEVAPLVLVGPAGWGPELDLSGLPPAAVRLPGYLAEPDLRRVVAGARLLAFPSRYEGFGLPPLEAMAAGVPVVASDLAAVREVTGGLVRLVPAGAAEPLAAALRAELDEPTPADRMAAARQHALAHTWARCAELTVAAYRQAAG